MTLYEFEGKELLNKYGITVPRFEILDSAEAVPSVSPPFFLKVQVLSGKRAASGGIVEVKNKKDFFSATKTIRSKKFNGETPQKIIAEEKISFTREHYLSVYYDTARRSPALLYTIDGGSGVEKRKIEKYSLRAEDGEMGNIPLPRPLIDKLLSLFFSEDCVLLEINPLVESEKNGKKIWMALDAKIKLDSTASGRHDWNYPPRSSGHAPTLREIEAKKIDDGDYRGTAGSSFFDMEGDIGILASGGGASLMALDALIKKKGKPANYTEYSGNPSKEKVEKLTKIVLSKPGLSGLWVIGGVANFTDIYETLSGLVDGLKKARQELSLTIDYPIVIRRGGPRDEEAFAMLAEVKDFDFHIYGRETSISKSAEEMVRLSNIYKKIKKSGVKSR
ncbi:MAG: hypothetical protein A3G52_01625 [Candidatus Taylorbacteria bacterium RIFCSPLOWO2_12_FULL_43_20]|uniref:ATP-grasp domain-containing protein n=1 Tax=Candidatus Taylorbacteria bacterium RIFCSPLOWO2_12_FULL_43_20 TaxID=1802332 RepID=A0A1G2P1Z1_9BACT|nr:MAG: hypothetical protein A2825_00135 [Candidatus Taylorbacteria bacterium RIFCSPHIGHO2_01_FULL_43_120]OHA22131.1 MAG: hypothetical protein A3B98_03785 [Candidatus Taylorbacteria bacterium RIFCSPHIGHO2_02_FULL_43_55]OHA30425.1 MAG: hypothetical protein A3E92_04235 [Candidatus Taylorbacteria bacterium RIFCSPHIGHO2_12_FULL_42_34]OHA32382.1 MAG: hypothetical protein A3B09_03785 [Candidatus Taylorbacteria bacterium RIFCSPLOWO2_01_FULL_43_83]OHA37817.1 MAG: hypothetical protein A3H58_02855 [Candi